MLSMIGVYSFLFAEKGALEAFYSSNNMLGYYILIAGFFIYFFIFTLLWKITETFTLKRVSLFSLDKLKVHVLGILIFTIFVICVYWIILPYNTHLLYNIAKDLILYYIFIMGSLGIYHYVVYCDEAPNADEKRKRLNIVGDNTMFITFFFGLVVVLIGLFVTLDMNYLSSEQFSKQPNNIQQLLEIHILVRDIVLGVEAVGMIIWFTIVVHQHLKVVK